jgi:hypothetical protein
MKLKSLILGSVAAAGLSTAGYAADLGVLTSLDVCDSLGISGLTISSSDNCLAISGGVEFDFEWGDFDGVIGGDDTLDWDSEIEAWIDFDATAASDFGPAAAHLGLISNNLTVVTDEAVVGALDDDVNLDHAYVSIGDTTVINAGLVEDALFDEFDFGAEDFGFADFFIEDFDAFANISLDRSEVGGHAIQVISTLGEGIKAGVGIENLAGAADEAGTVAGYVSYAGEGISAFVYGDIGGVLDGFVSNWEVDAGVTANFDNFNLGAQFLYVGNDGGLDGWSVLGVAGATFDMFTIAIDTAYATSDIDPESFSIQGSVGASVTETVAINLAAAYFDGDLDLDALESYQIALQLVADLSETLTATAEIGIEGVVDVDSDFYGDVELGWEPGGNFESYVGARFEEDGEYSVRAGALKEFQ